MLGFVAGEGAGKPQTNFFFYSKSKAKFGNYPCNSEEVFQ